MKTILAYICTPGIGENIQVLPALWEWSKEPETPVLMVCPPAQAALFHGTSIDHSGHKTSFEAIGYPLGWFPSGHVALDFKLVETLEREMKRLGGEKLEVKCRSDFELLTTVPAWLTVHSKHRDGGAVGVPACNKEMLNGTQVFPDSPLTLADWTKWVPKLPDELGEITVCFGSHESMRRIPPSTFGKLVVQLIQHGRVPNLIVPNDEYVSFIRAHLKGVKHPTKGTEMVMEDMLYAVDERTPASLKETAAMIGMSQVVISPDTGTAHIAVAYGRGLVFLESREPAEQVFAPETLASPIFANIDVNDTAASGLRAACNMDCRGVLGARGHVEKGYPFNIACSKLSCVPCLCFKEDFIETLAKTAIAMVALAAPTVLSTVAIDDPSSPKTKTVRLKRKHRGDGSANEAEAVPNEA